MPHIERHQFECPGDDPTIWECPNDDAVLWRYMDLAKLLVMLESKTLYFSRADLLGDPFENTIPKANIAKFENEFNACSSNDNNNADHLAQQYMFFEEIHKAAQTTYVSCWHNNEHESAACGSYTSKAMKGLQSKLPLGV